MQSLLLFSCEKKGIDLIENLHQSLSVNRLAETLIIKESPKPSANIHQLKQPKAVEPQPIVGGCWVIEGDTIHIGSNKIRLQESSSDTLSHCFYYTYELQSTYKVENVVLILLRFFFTVTKKLTKYTHNGKT